MLTSFARSFSTSAFATLRTSKNVVVGPGQLRLMSSRTPNGKKRIPSGVAQTPNEIIAGRELPVTVLWTIGDASAAKLKAAGIHHLSHLLVKYAEDPGNFQPFLQGLGIHYDIDLRAFHPRKVLVGRKRVTNASTPQITAHQVPSRGYRAMKSSETNDSQAREQNEEGSMSASSTEELNFDDKALFASAKKHLPPGLFFRLIMWLYAERKMVMLSLMHFVATMVIWVHFGLIKFQEQESKVPATANRFWWKRLTPPLEFGSMHAILFQMALIPFTMSRFSIAALSGSIVDRFVPLNRTLQMHIHLGYTMVTIVFVATIFFFGFFGMLCNDGEQAFCDKFTSEIMCTGYGILASLLIVAFSSYFRYKIPYEIFYIIHHLVFAMYIITIAHTIDVVERKGLRDRSQTFKWFSAPLLYYACDRAIMYINHRYTTPVKTSVAVESANGSRMIILKLKRPTLFEFQPGQYAFLRVSDIDINWHPFSIASNPSSPNLEFYIEVFDKESWTGKLYNRLKREAHKGRVMEVEVLGPYGTALVNRGGITNVLSIGAGTGIVPILSLFQEHVKRMKMLDPSAHLIEQQEVERNSVEVRRAMEARQVPLISYVVNPGCFKKAAQHEESKVSRRSTMMRNSLTRMSLAESVAEVRQSSKKLKRAALSVTQSLYGKVLQTVLGAYGIMVIGLLISWNKTPIDLYPNMINILMSFTVSFQIAFALVSTCFWNGRNFFAFIDLWMAIISFFADWYWYIMYDENERLPDPQIAASVVALGYMTLRLWARTVLSEEPNQLAASVSGLKSIERLDMVWVARSAKLVSKVLPDINDQWESLVNAWGEDFAHEVCRVSVYVTDKDPTARQLLQDDMKGMRLFQDGRVHFGRPDFAELIENHTLDMIETRNYSSSLLAFCGSPRLSSYLRRTKIANDMVTAMTGHKHHKMEFIAESYGGIKAPSATEGTDSVEGNLKTQSFETAETQEKDATEKEEWDPLQISSKGSNLANRESVSFGQQMDSEQGVREFEDRASLVRAYSTRETGVKRSKSSRANVFSTLGTVARQRSLPMMKQHTTIRFSSQSSRDIYQRVYSTDQSCDSEEV